MTEKRRGTPLLDELEKGPWPSFVKEMKKEAHRPMAADALGILERSYEEHVSHWKHGGLVGVMGYGGGVIGRYSDLPEEFPEVREFHTFRVNQPSAWFYTSDALRTLCDIWEKHGSGLTNMHGSTGDIIFLGGKTEALEPIFAELTANDWDLGGSGSDLRTPSCCVGPARCEWACYDTLEACYDITQHFQDELHRPVFPYKFKFKFAGCPNDCVASIARSDCSVIGTWKDDIRVDQAEVREYAKDLDIAEVVVQALPDPLHGVGRQEARDRQLQLRQVHALHQRDAQGAQARQGARRRRSSSAPRRRSSVARCCRRCSFRSSR